MVCFENDLWFKFEYLIALREPFLLFCLTECILCARRKIKSVPYGERIMITEVK